KKVPNSNTNNNTRDERGIERQEPVKEERKAPEKKIYISSIIQGKHANNKEKNQDEQKDSTANDANNKEKTTGMATPTTRKKHWKDN
ncbi:21159_t:CDS:2, partial [Gigaspora rosea]